METFTTDDIFKAMNRISKNIGWATRIGICTDGAASMIGIHLGVVTRLKVEHTNINSNHSYLYIKNIGL